MVSIRTWSLCSFISSRNSSPKIIRFRSIFMPWVIISNPSWTSIFWWQSIPPIRIWYYWISIICPRISIVITLNPRKSIVISPLICISKRIKIWISEIFIINGCSSKITIHHNIFNQMSIWIYHIDIQISIYQSIIPMCIESNIIHHYIVI